MIIDRLENADLYSGLGDRVAAAVRWLRETDLVALEAGRYEIDGDALYAMVMDYDTKPAAGAFWEAHRRYIDVQVVASGVERMGYAHIADLAEAEPYDADKDFLKLDGDGDMLRVDTGTFVIFHPHDAHMPGLALDGPVPVRKVVVKVLVG